MNTTQRKKRLRYEDLFDEIQYQFYLDIGRISMICPPSCFFLTLSINNFKRHLVFSSFPV